MNKNQLRGAASVALLAAAMMQSSCGTLLYGERSGQDTDGLSADPAVVLMDGALLLLLILPGVVAYVIDFHTGAIYEPGT